MNVPESPLTLAHWRRTVAELYADVRESAVPDIAAAASRYRAARDRLFADHPDSPIASNERSRWRGSSWYPYDPAWRTTGIVDPVRSSTFEIPLAADVVFRCLRERRNRKAGRAFSAALSREHFDICSLDVPAAAIGVEKRKDMTIVVEPLLDASERARLSRKLQRECFVLGKRSRHELRQSDRLQ